MVRRRTTTANDFTVVVARFPWWLGIVAALASFLILNYVANLNFAAPRDIASLGTNAAQQIVKTIAWFGQYILPLLFLFGAVLSMIGRSKRQSLHQQTFTGNAHHAIDGMSWREFEMLVGEAFRCSGYAVTETGGGGADEGVDLALSKDNEKFLVQCKQWRAMKVGVTTVRELYGIMAAKGAAGGFVVTSGKFTREAEGFAAGRNITLIDGVVLIELIKGLEEISVTSVDRTRHHGDARNDAASPLCPTCGGNMIKRVSKRGLNAGDEFWGCAKYPSCKGIRNF